MKGGRKGGREERKEGGKEGDSRVHIFTHARYMYVHDAMTSLILITTFFPPPTY